MKIIQRRRTANSRSSNNANGQQAATAPVTASERHNFRAQIEKLKLENGQLLMEHQMQEQEWRQNQMLLDHSKDRLQRLELNQQSWLSSVGQVLQISEEEASLQPPTGNTGRKRSHLDNIPFNNSAGIEFLKEPSAELTRENAASMSVLPINMERLDLLESSLAYWENLVNEVHNTFLEARSNLEFNDSMNRPHSSVMTSAQTDFEDQPESSGKEMNYGLDLAIAHDPLELEPGNIFAHDPIIPLQPAAIAIPVAPVPAVTTVPDSAVPNEQPVATVPGTRGYNTPFWARYLVESPVEDESKSLSQLSKYCWSMKNKKHPQIDPAKKA